LCDVAPDGASTRVTYGVLNLSHRESHAEPEALVPGQPYRVRVQLNEIAQNFSSGAPHSGQREFQLLAPDLAFAGTAGTHHLV